MRSVVSVFCLVCLLDTVLCVLPVEVYLSTHKKFQTTAILYMSYIIYSHLYKNIITHIWPNKHHQFCSLPLYVMPNLIVPYHKNFQHSVFATHCEFKTINEMKPGHPVPSFICSVRYLFLFFFLPCVGVILWSVGCPPELIHLNSKTLFSFVPQVKDKNEK